MQVQKQQLTDTRIKLAVEADQQLLEDVKRSVLQQYKKDIRIAGFRKGKAPIELVEKHIDQAAFQREFLDMALNRMYITALGEHKIRPVSQPDVTVKKFVPYTVFEFDAEVDVIGEVVLPDYKKIKLEKKPVKVSTKDVSDVIDNLKIRLAEKKEVTRAAKDTDEVWIDFAGRDAKTNEPIQGADGKDYPLILGSNTFIPGFETNLIGVKAGDEKEFTLEFPKDYGVKALQGRKVTFTTSVKKVSQVVLPKEDDAFAAKAGPFKSIEELRSDIKKQISVEREQQNDRDYESELLSQVTEKSEVAVPKQLVDEELNRLEREERQNIVYKGQTWEEHLASEGVTDEEHREKNRPGAEMRVRAGLALAEIAEKEKIEVLPDELELRVQLLKGQYQDPQMQAELDKPENKRELASRIMSEKTIAKLVGYANTKSPRKSA